MNVILVVSDTFRYDNLSCYGPAQVRTPRLDQFATQAFVFDNAYLGSYPTVPCRLDIMSGRFSFIDHEWCPLPKDTVTLQQVLSASGVVTYLIVDNPHMCEMGFNYERGFDAFDWIRGQETDRWSTSPRHVEMHAPDKNRAPFIFRTYLRNTAWWQSEEDHFAPRSIRSACRWLEQNQDHEQFFLHIELFDPHEPWDAPQKYLDMYPTAYRGEPIIFPRYGFSQEFLTQDELLHIRSQYYAEVSMVDHWFGVLLDKVDELGLSEDTAIIFVSDHGHLFGEHGLHGKSLMPQVDGRILFESTPLYNEIRRVPLLIRLAGQTQTQQISGLVQIPDLMPTVLEIEGMVATESVGGQSRTQALQCGVFYTEDWQFSPENIHGKSLMPLMRGEVDKVRDIAVCSNTLTQHTPILAKSAIVTQDGWCLHYAGQYEEIDTAACMYINKLVDPNQARISTQPALYYLSDDPMEMSNILDENQQLARRYTRVTSDGSRT